MDSNTAYLLDLAERADTDSPWLRNTTLSLLRLSIRLTKILLLLCCLLFSFGLFVCWFPLWVTSWLPDSIVLVILRSVVFGGMGLMGVVFFVIQWKSLHRLEEEFFLRRLTWVQDEINRE
jgi:hypothetical protein